MRFFLASLLDHFRQLGELFFDFLLNLRSEVFGLSGIRDLHLSLQYASRTTARGSRKALFPWVYYARTRR
jgi:hypothetical protein